MPQFTRTLFAAFLLSMLGTFVNGQGNVTAKANALQPPAAADSAGSENDRARDGLLGPVRRIRTEVVRVSNASGRAGAASKSVVLETAEYDLRGVKTQNQYFPIEGATLTGREVYKYNDRGNISEMALLNADGSLVSKEVYQYEYDAVGNWVKMTASVAVVENGNVGFEPSEVTSRTIFYYLDAATARMLQPASYSASAPVSASGAGANANANGNRKESDSRGAQALPPPVNSTCTLRSTTLVMGSSAQLSTESAER